jgi:predicted ATP-grasp superfamily ATP-dependent carboligase
MPAAVACYTSNFENYPSAVVALSRGRELLGNPPAVLHRVRDPREFARKLQAAGVVTPRVRLRPPLSRGGDAKREWLRKPISSGGGHGVIIWRRGITVTRRHVLQERIAGVPASILFVADGRRSHLLGITIQLIGDENFGSHGFRYCGNILPVPTDPVWGEESRLADEARMLAEISVHAFGLVGVNGIDVIVRDGSLVPLEVNPRYTAAMELIERRDATSVFRAHMAGCKRRLDKWTALPAARSVAGKAIVFTPRSAIAPDTTRWLDDPDLADIPMPGTKLRSGAPVCSVFAAGRTREVVYRRLVQKARWVMRAIQPA